MIVRDVNVKIYVVLLIGRCHTETLVQVGPRDDQTERVRLTVTITVISVDYDGEAECRCKGTCCSENPYIPLGAFHTIVLEPGAQLTLTKECWDMLDIRRLDEAAEPASSSDLAIVLISEGIAHVCLIGKSSTSLRSKVSRFSSAIQFIAMVTDDTPAVTASSPL